MAKASIDVYSCAGRLIRSINVRPPGRMRLQHTHTHTGLADAPLVGQGHHQGPRLVRGREAAGRHRGRHGALLLRPAGRLCTLYAGPCAHYHHHSCLLSYRRTHANASRTRTSTASSPAASTTRASSRCSATTTSSRSPPTPNRAPGCSPYRPPSPSSRGTSYRPPTRCRAPSRSSSPLATPCTSSMPPKPRTATSTPGPSDTSASARAASSLPSTRKMARSGSSAATGARSSASTTAASRRCPRTCSGAAPMLLPWPGRTRCI